MLKSVRQRASPRRVATACAMAAPSAVAPASTELIESYERMFGRASQHGARLAEFNHKGGLSARQVVLGQRGEDGVHGGHLERRRGHVGADMRHAGGETHLSEIGGFTSHVRSGDKTEGGMRTAETQPAFGTKERARGARTGATVRSPRASPARRRPDEEYLGRAHGSARRAHLLAHNG